MVKSTSEGHSGIPLAFFLFLFLFLGMCPPSCHGSGMAADAAVAIGACGGKSAGGCLLESGVGVELGSEVSRRLMQQSQNQRYISYRFLNGDVVPCSTPGVSYYSCHALPSSDNPHSRGCSTITRCARDTVP